MKFFNMKKYICPTFYFLPFEGNQKNHINLITLFSSSWYNMKPYCVSELKIDKEVQSVNQSLFL